MWVFHSWWGKCLSLNLSIHSGPDGNMGRAALPPSSFEGWLQRPFGLQVSWGSPAWTGWTQPPHPRSGTRMPTLPWPEAPSSSDGLP